MSTLYVLLADLKTDLNIEADDTSRDERLTKAITAASRSIDRTTGRRFWLDPEPAARTINPRGRTVCDSDGDHLLTADIGTTAVTVETGTTDSWTPVSGVELEPTDALDQGQPVTSLLRPGSWWAAGSGVRVRVTARWGWPEVPAEVQQAALIQAMRLYRRKDSPEGVAGSAEWGVMRLSRRDPDVYGLIEHLVLPGLA